MAKVLTSGVTVNGLKRKTQSYSHDSENMSVISVLQYDIEIFLQKTNF